MAEYSLELTEDQLQIQKWVHDFADTVVRPAAHEWDEREETPWPIIEEAAKIGLYSLDFVSQCFLDTTGLLLPLVQEEMAWGDAGINLAIFGTTLAVAGIFANGTDEQIGEFLPQCFGTPDEIIEKIRTLQGALSLEMVVIHMFYGGMPRARAEKSLRLFAEKVLPAVQAMPTPINPASLGQP